jgi:hypothetical protein
MVAVGQDKPTSEQLRLEAERLRTTADKLIEYADTLIAKSAELEKEISRPKHNPKQSKNS